MNHRSPRFITDCRLRFPKSSVKHVILVRREEFAKVLADVRAQLVVLVVARCVPGHGSVLFEFWMNGLAFSALLTTLLSRAQEWHTEKTPKQVVSSLQLVPGGRSFRAAPLAYFELCIVLTIH